MAPPLGPRLGQPDQLSPGARVCRLQLFRLLLETAGVARLENQLRKRTIDLIWCATRELDGEANNNNNQTSPRPICRPLERRARQI